MRRFTLLLFVIMLVPATLWAQAGVICLFADDTGSDCTFEDTEPGTMSFFVIHSGMAGGTAVRFSAPKPDCMVGATWLADSNVYPVTLGNSQEGISIGYGSCVFTDTHVLTITYVTTGQTTMDCAYPVLADQLLSSLEMIDCTAQSLTFPGGTSYINSSLPCDCEPDFISPEIIASPPALDFAYGDDDESFAIFDNGTETIVWDVTTTAQWLTLGQTSGTGAATVTATADRSNLIAGNHTGSITVNSNHGSQLLFVILRNDGTSLSIEPLHLDFGLSSSVQTFELTNAGGGTLTWQIDHSIPWVTEVVPAIGLTDETVRVTIDRALLVEGRSFGTLEVTSNVGSLDVVVIATRPPQRLPSMVFGPYALDFPNGVAQQTLQIDNVGDGDLEWSVISDRNWLSVAPVSGTNSTAVTVTVNRGMLLQGNYAGTLTINSNGGYGTVPVSVSVMDSPLLVVAPTSLFYTTSAAKDFLIINAGVGDLTWQLFASKPWIRIESATSGSGDATVTVSLDEASLPAGSPSGVINITSNGGDLAVPVFFTQPPPPFAGTIGVYADQSGQSCNITANGSPQGELVQIHVVHTGTTGATGVQFYAPIPGCLSGATHMGDTQMFAVSLGSSQSGVSVGYGNCLAAPIHIMTINLMVYDAPNSCCEFSVLPHPNGNSGEVEIIDCGQNSAFVQGVSAHVNPDSGCPCGVTAVEESTWGAVKALYADEN